MNEKIFVILNSILAKQKQKKEFNLNEANDIIRDFLELNEENTTNYMNYFIKKEYIINNNNETYSINKDKLKFLSLGNNKIFNTLLDVKEVLQTEKKTYNEEYFGIDVHDTLRDILSISEQQCKLKN
jgi:hypothetical protein